jgi:hypothetical protein
MAKKIKTWVIIRTIKEHFQVEAPTKKEAHESLAANGCVPYDVQVTSEKSFSVPDNKQLLTIKPKK